MTYYHLLREEKIKMEVIEIRKEVVEIDLEEEVEMEIAHFVKPLEKELEQIGFTVHFD